MSDQPPNSSASRGWVKTTLAELGRPVVNVYRTVTGIADLFAWTFYYLIHGERRWKSVLKQMHSIGNRSLFFIAVTLGFLGMILIFQAGYQANRITGDLHLIGALFLQILLREFAPTITAMMIATRVGTGMAAEIGSMVVTEQVDALRMSSAQPVDYLVVPRFIACTVMTVCLTIFAVVVSYLAGAATANLVFGLNLRTFFNMSLIGWFDVNIGLIKAVAYGMTVPVVSCHAGLTVFGGSEGVGRATTRAVVNASLGVVILDFVLSGIGYLILNLL